MNWDQAIESKRVPLLGIVLALLAEIGLAGEGAVDRLSRPVYRYALRQLRKAESAARRLIFAAARNIVLEPPPSRPERAKPKTEPAAKAETTVKIRRTRRPSFNLFDPRKRFERAIGARPNAVAPSPAPATLITTRAIHGSACSAGPKPRPRRLLPKRDRRQLNRPNRSQLRASRR